MRRLVAAFGLPRTRRKPDCMANRCKNLDVEKGITILDHMIALIKTLPGK